MKKKEIQKNKLTKKFWIILIVGIISIFLVILFVFDESYKDSTQSDIENYRQTNEEVSTKTPICQDVQVPYEAQEEYMKTEYYKETVPYTDKECESKYLIYKKDNGQCKQKVDNFFADDEPAKYECTITNLDSESGTFSMKIGFNVQGQSLEELQEYFIYPQSSKIFSIQRDATIESCFCREEKIPTKQVCRDVIKYKDIQKERQVTAYKPVTKYRTEKKCD